MVAQLENTVLEEYIQTCYQQEKGGMLYHKLQEIPIDMI